MNKMSKKDIGSVKLIILDGWGHAPPWGGNAVSQARTPNFNWAWRKYPHTLLEASGESVGLPGHEMGNSEVGHMTLGAGRIIPQDISKINVAIEDGSFFENKQIEEAIDQQKKNNSKLQIIGLLSSGGIHSHIDHLFALLKIIKKKKVENVYLHLITDGRDSPPRSAQTYISKLIHKIEKMGLADSVKIASISGRFYAMDRDNNLKRTNLAYQSMVSSRGRKNDSPLAAVSKSYRDGVTDQYIIPTVIDQSGVIEDKDSVIFLNFRSDRARQLTSFFIDPNLKFKREKVFKDLHFVSMVPYQTYDQHLPYQSAFPTKEIDNPLAKIVADNNFKQLHVAETEKYAHVTYFFNGMVEDPFVNEDRVLIPSPKVETYDQQPEMNAEKVCDEILKAQKSKKYQFVLANFANPDMVGHTGNLAAVIKAVEEVDQQLGRIFENIQKDETIIVTADHGNAEEMIDSKTGGKNTEHTNNPVPFILINHHKENLEPNRSIAGIANLILDQLEIEVPSEMKKESLFK
jgi:2,3-bisphosphoglycerate-independent phosphoglycerate mutase